MDILPAPDTDVILVEREVTDDRRATPTPVIDGPGSVQGLTATGRAGI